MDTLLLTRFAYHDFGTYGAFTLPDDSEIYTVERPWINNETWVSCIPEGTYICKPRWYNKGKYDAIEVTGVKDRTYIMFHIGNYVRNSSGCILPNTYLKLGKNKIRGVDSTTAFNHFMDFYNKEFELTIKSFKAIL